MRPSLIISAHDHKVGRKKVRVSVRGDLRYARLKSRLISQASAAHRPYPDRSPFGTSQSPSSDFTVYELSSNPASMQEVVVPTCSYRMVNFQSYFKGRLSIFK